MTRGGRFLLLGGCLAASACTQAGDVRVRAIADPAAKVRFGGGLLADARAQLALGDVGIALETFQTLLRREPENPDAYAGIAACYAAMGRYDVARQNYEYALAYAPNDPALLTAFAGTLERLGETDQAAQVRVEAAHLRTAARSLAAAQPAITPLAVPRLSSVTVELPALAQASTAPAHPAAPAIAAKPLGSAPAQKPPASKAPEPKAPAVMRAPATPVAPTELAAIGERPALARAQRRDFSLPAIAQPQPELASVNLIPAHLMPKAADVSIAELSIAPPEAVPPLANAVPPAAKPKSAAARPSPAPLAPRKERPVTDSKTVALAAKEPSVEPVSRPREVIIATADPQIANGPYLRRLSTGEVSLVTLPAARVAHSWPRLPQLARPAPSELVRPSVPGQAAPRLANASAIRWVPLKYASAAVNIQLLNAGRIQSLAAHTRVALMDRGWRKIGIGDARSVRQHSLVLYSPARAGLAHRLAAQFRCKSLKVEHIQNVVVLLGRDAMFARRSSTRA